MLSFTLIALIGIVSTSVNSFILIVQLTEFPTLILPSLLSVTSTSKVDPLDEYVPTEDILVILPVYTLVESTVKLTLTFWFKLRDVISLSLTLISTINLSILDTSI